MTSIGIILIAACALSAYMTHWLSSPKSPLRLLDHPNERSLHDRPIPRSGGIAIFITLACAITAIVLLNGPPEGITWWASAAFAVAAVSFLDDLAGVPIFYRLFVHVLAGGALFLGGFQIDALALPGWNWIWPSWLVVPITIIFVVWMINLYNFMDGMDGFAAGMAIIGFGTLACLGALGGDLVFVAANLSIVAVVGGFLPFNFPPARIFMGDLGASLLGFFAAAFSLWGTKLEIFRLWMALVAFSPFILDATITLFRRIAHGEKPWHAHKSHYYQRLVLVGWGHRRTVLWEYLLMSVCAGSAIAATRFSAGWQWGIIAAMGSAYLALVFWVERKTRT